MRLLGASVRSLAWSLLVYPEASSSATSPTRSWWSGPLANVAPIAEPGLGIGGARHGGSNQAGRTAFLWAPARADPRLIDPGGSGLGCGFTGVAGAIAHSRWGSTCRLGFLRQGASISQGWLITFWWWTLRALDMNEWGGDVAFLANIMHD